MRKIGLIQVPHYGSKNNFNIEIFSMFSYAIYFISAGYTNRYKHPSYNVLKEFIINNKNLKLITKQIGSRFMMNVDVL